MSTILDALRKVEEEQRARTTDARARLLLSSLPPLPGHARLRVPASWLVGIGFALAGFVGGLGVVRWWFPSRVAQERTTSSPPQTGTLAQRAPTADLPAPRPSEGTLATAAPVVVPSGSLPPREEVYESSWENPLATVQRSPFVSTPPAREATTGPQPPSPFPSTVQGEQSPVFVTGADLSGTGRGATVSGVLPEQAMPREAARLSPTSPDTLSQAPVAGQTETSASEPGSVLTNTAVSFLQWSPDPSKRIAFVKMNNGPLTLVQEGDTVNGFTVVEIRRTEVELRSGNSRITLQAN